MVGYMQNCFGAEDVGLGLIVKYIRRALRIKSLLTETICLEGGKEWFWEAGYIEKWYWDARSACFCRFWSESRKCYERGECRRAHSISCTCIGMDSYGSDPPDDKVTYGVNYQKRYGDILEGFYTGLDTDNWEHCTFFGQGAKTKLKVEEWKSTQ